MPRYLLALPLIALAALAHAVPPDGANPAKQPKALTGDDAAAAAQVQPADKGLKVDVWAAAPLMANPVAFCFDEKGKCYVAETTRFEKGVPDTRGHMQWLDEDLANRSIQDLLEMYKKHKYQGFEKYSDQVRAVWDSTNSGRADKSEVFSGGYNRPQDGLAAGVLARKGQVYLTCIPDLYVLKDTNGDGKADDKQSLFTGFGPTVQFLGHDLHGLRMGPDGKLYFSVGDRGFVVKTKEGTTLSYPNQGAVLRCDPDGRNLEVVHAGLRNPQEIAFDDLGNLFTYDNNCDSGDRARWVHIVEGGDSGWRGGFQYGTGYHTPAVPQGNRGAWNTEKLWHTQHEGQPAWVVPPLAHFGNGPAGITHYPGIGLNDKYKDHFFACDFTSNPGSSVIWAVSVKPKGASFEVKHEPFLRGLVPTDCEFGPDGAFYWSDWVGGWAPQNRGRIFRATDPEAMKNPQVAEAQKLLAAGFDKKTVADLAKLLEFPHQLVRQEAQFELAGRKPEEATKAFVAVFKESKNQLARLHAVWGLGMLAHKDPKQQATLFKLLKEVPASDTEVKCQVLKALGENGLVSQEVPVVLPYLRDPEPRVRFFAAQLIGNKLFRTADEKEDELNEKLVSAVLEMIDANADRDPYLRHAGVSALVKLVGRLQCQIKVTAKSSPSVRLAAVLAYRRLKYDNLRGFLTDPDPRVVAEAARAIYDERIRGGEALAALAEKPGLPDAVSFRALAANYVIGTPVCADRVAGFAARQNEPDYVRAFALKLLSDWPKPPRRDPITGLTLDLPTRDPKAAVAALKTAGVNVFAGSDVVRKEAAQAVAKLNIQEFGPALAALVRDSNNPVATRVESLLALDALKSPQAKELAAFALASDQPRLRAAGRAVRAHLEPAVVLKELPALLADDSASVAEKQGAFAILAAQKASDEADKLLADWLDKVNAGTVPSALILDVLEAAETRAATPKLKLAVPLKPKVDAYRAAQAKAANDPKGDKLATHFDALEGGDADRGRNLFLNNSAVYCQRCHKLDGQGGDVGPLMNGLAADKDKDRRYLLEAIVMPNAKIAKGYDTVILLLNDDTTVSGIVKSEDKKQIKLVTAENKEIVVPVEDVQRRRTGPSAMPDDLHKKLSRRELRDLVEFLASLKEQPKK